MDIHVLRYFVTVARLQHMGRAAEALHLTQPSLSISLKRLEAELGYPLFDRTGRGIRLNEYGKIYLRSVEEALNSLDTAMAEMGSIKQKAESIVKIACRDSEQNSQLITWLLAQGFHLNVELLTDGWEEKLLIRELDLVITVGKTKEKRISQLPLAEWDWVFVVSDKHPLAEKAHLRLADLAPFEFCSLNASYAMLNVVWELLEEKNFTPNITFYGRNSRDMVKAIRTGKYIGLMIKKKLPQDDNLKILELEDMKIIRPIYIYIRKTSEKNEQLCRVRSLIQDFYSRELEQMN